MIYLDSAATLPIWPELQTKIKNFPLEILANASSTHQLGQKNKEIIENARHTVASCLNAQPSEVIFTSGATESLQLTIIGAILAKKIEQRNIMYSPLLHSAAKNAIFYCEQYLNTKKIKIPLKKTGNWSIKECFEQKIKQGSVFIAESTQSEVGIEQNVQDLYTNAKKNKENMVIIDTVASFMCKSINWQQFPADVICFSAEKIGGLAGTGCFVYKKKEINQKNFHIPFGGTQERGLRAGTHNVLGIWAFAQAMQIMQKKRSNYLQKYSNFQQILDNFTMKNKYFSTTLEKSTTKTQHIYHLHHKNITGELLVAILDQKGFAVSAGTACQSGSVGASQILKHLGLKEQAKNGLRISFCPWTTKKEIEKLIKALKEIK